MRKVAIIALILITSSTNVEAKRGGFLAGLLLRGLGRGAGELTQPQTQTLPRTYDSMTLRPTQLKDCVVQAMELDQMSDVIHSDEARLSVTRKSLEEKSHEFEVEFQTVDTTSQFEVDDFNRRMTEFKDEQDRFNQAIVVFNVKVEDHTTFGQQYNDDCGSKGYYEVDLRAVQEELGVPFTP